MWVCAVLGCTNGSYQLGKWNWSTCTTHGTRKEICVCQPPYQYHRFPTTKKNSELRERWNKLINKADPMTGKNWEAKKHDVVCSKHFPDGHPTDANPSPTLHLGYEVPVKEDVTTNCTPPKPIPPAPSSSEEANLLPSSSESSSAETKQKPIHDLKHDHQYMTYMYKCDCKPACDCVGCITKQARIRVLEEKQHDLKEKVQCLQNKLKKKRKQIINSDSFTTDDSVNHCTGLGCKKTLDDMFNFIEPSAKNMPLWQGSKSETTSNSKSHRTISSKTGRKRKLPLKDEFVIVLMRLRLGLTLAFIYFLFDVTPSHCSKIITIWIRLLAEVLKPLIVWPSRPTISKLMPKQFKDKCRKLRCIIDCTEIFLERPRSLDLQAETWSDYKKHNTLKILVAITPNGHISFLSRAYGGRASDVHIVRKSGFLSLVEPNDVIMADRGFPIQEDLMLHHATLEIPPAAQGHKQMTRTKVQKTKSVANLRIHVERAINQLKYFKIIDGTFPISLIPLSDDIITICAALVNLQPDLIK